MDIVIIITATIIDIIIRFFIIKFIFSKKRKLKGSYIQFFCYIFASDLILVLQIYKKEFTIMNKKKILGSIAILAIAALAAFNVNININKNLLSGFSLDNIEALAQESGSPKCVPSKGFCFKNEVKIDHISIQL